MNIKMKNIILIICIFLPMWVLSQKINTDTSLICIPYKVAKKIALDLNKLDSLTEIDKLTKIEIFEIGKKVTIQENIINLLEQKEKNYELQIKKENEKFVIVDTQNNNLRKDEVISNHEIAEKIIEAFPDKQDEYIKVKSIL